MIYRNALEFLSYWKESKIRKPLVIRGARQVGKTTLVKEFAKHIELNLEKPTERQLSSKRFLY